MRQVATNLVSEIEQLIEELPAYIRDNDESDRLFLFISRDIQGKWIASYETKGRHYYHATDNTLLGVITLLRYNLQEAGFIK